MFGGFFACVTEGTKAVGGISEVFKVADKGGRINFAK